MLRAKKKVRRSTSDRIHEIEWASIRHMVRFFENNLLVSHSHAGPSAGKVLKFDHRELHLALKHGYVYTVALKRRQKNDDLWDSDEEETWTWTGGHRGAEIVFDAATMRDEFLASQLPKLNRLLSDCLEHEIRPKFIACIWNLVLSFLGPIELLNMRETLIRLTVTDQKLQEAERIGFDDPRWAL